MNTTKKVRGIKLQNIKTKIKEPANDDITIITIQNKSRKRIRLKISYQGTINSENYFSFEAKTIVTGDSNAPIIYFPTPICEKFKVKIVKVTFYIVLVDDDYTEREILDSEYNKILKDIKYESGKTLKSFSINYEEIVLRTNEFEGKYGTKAVYTVSME